MLTSCLFSFEMADLNGSPEIVGRHIGRFAAGVLLLADSLNPRLTVPQLRSVPGLRLRLRKSYLIGILCGLVAVQLVFFVGASLLASSVVVKDDSDVATARLLRRKICDVPGVELRPLTFLLCVALVARLGEGGTTYTGKEIDRKIPVKVVYGAKHTTIDTHRLALDEDVPILESSRSFPSGVYD